MLIQSNKYDKVNTIADLKKHKTSDQDFLQTVSSIHHHMVHTNGHQIEVEMSHVDISCNCLGQFQKSREGKSLENNLNKICQYTMVTLEMISKYYGSLQLRSRYSYRDDILELLGKLHLAVV